MPTFHHYYLTAHLSRKLGHDTYLAYPVDQPEQHVVLKVFDEACIAPEATPNDFRQLEARLRDVKHPHIVAVLELGIEQGKPYIVSEYHIGSSLLQYLEQRASEHLSLEEAVGVVMQVGRAVAFVHTHGIFHQDIRPENILLNQQGQTLLADFRLSSLIQEPGWKNSANRRVRSYQAPEQMIGSASAASDQYALGCLLYELLTRIVPDPPVLRQQATLTPLVAPTTLPVLPPQIAAVILRTLAINPRERYPDVTTFLAELKSAVRPEPPAFPFAHLTSRYQQAASSDLTEEEFLPLVPNMPFMLPTALQREKEGAPTLPAAISLEAFLTAPEWDGVSLLDRLAIIGGQEDALVLPGGSEMHAASTEELAVSPATEEEAEAKATVAARGKESVEDGAWQVHAPGREKYQSGTHRIFAQKQRELTARARPGWMWPVVLVGMALLLTVVSVLLVGVVQHATPPVSLATPALRGAGSVQIDAGGSGAGSFVADEDVTNTTPGRTSSTVWVSSAIDTSGVSDPAPQSAYQSARIGDFLYTIPHLTPQASYKVRLHFAETYWTKAGKRIFNVLINNQPVLRGFDIFAAAGARDKAIVEAFVVPANRNGIITIQFVTIQDNAQINAIEVLAT